MNFCPSPKAQGLEAQMVQILVQGHLNRLTKESWPLLDVGAIIQSIVCLGREW